MENKISKFKATVGIDGRVTIPDIELEYLGATPGTILLISAENTGIVKDIQKRKKRKTK